MERNFRIIGLCILMALVTGCYSIETVSSLSKAESVFEESSEPVISLSQSSVESIRITSQNTISQPSEPSHKTSSVASMASITSISVSSAPAKTSSASVAVSSEIPASSSVMLSPDEVTAAQIAETLNNYFNMDMMTKNQEKPYPILPSTLLNLKYNVYKNSGPFDAFDYRIEVSNFTSFFMYVFCTQPVTVERRTTERQSLIDYIEREGNYLCAAYPGIKLSFSFYESKPSAGTTSSETSTAYRNMFRGKTYFTWVNYSPPVKITENAYSLTKAGEFNWYPAADSVLEVKDGGVLVITGDTATWRPK